MGIASLAARGVKSISRYNARRLGKKRTAPVISGRRLKTVKGDSFTVGFACCEVMPDDIGKKDYWIAGYGMGKKIEGVSDPITLRAVWIGCGENGGIATVFADCIGLTGVEVGRVRDMLSDFARRSKCLKVNVSCTHSHAGFDTVGYWGKLPKTGRDEDYMNKLLSSMCRVCIEAYNNREPGDMYVGYADAPQGQLKKRQPLVLNPTLTRLRFVPKNGGKETWILNYAAHPNTLGGANRLVSADYPYYLREKIMAEKDVNVAFGVGAIGGVDPGDFSEDRIERTRMQGEYLALKALSITEERQLDSFLKVMRQPYYSPVDNGVLAFLASLKVMNTKRYPCEKGELGLALKTEMTYINLGGLQILLLPGESFPETVYGGYSDAEESATGLSGEVNPKPLTRIADDDKLLVFGVTNDMTGYVVPPNEFVLNPTEPYLSNGRDRFHRSHYHETNSLGLLTQAAIAQTFTHMMKRIK